MSRDLFRMLLAEAGASYAASLTPSVNLLVIGAERWPLDREGRLSSKLLAAQRLQRSGTDIEILSEEAFMSRIAAVPADDGARSRYSLLDLSRILGVAGARLRSWMTAGLIEPAEPGSLSPTFEYRQVRGIQSLMGMLTAGVSPQQIRRSLRQLHRWLPRSDAAADALARMESDGRRLLLSMPDGSPAEPSGQLLLDFDKEDMPVALSLRQEGMRYGDDLFLQGVECEEQGDFVAAAQFYRRSLEIEGPDPDVCFNLANVLYAAGRHEGAIERYRQVVEIDPGFPEAWCNLGNALAGSDRPREAIDALRTALVLDPGCVDAHYSLADLFDELGEHEEARRHFEAYLQVESAGEWAEHARARLNAWGA
jgi:tetratricopeptide (TPR) repeat protein